MVDLAIPTSLIQEKVQVCFWFLLFESNYHMWNRAMMVALDAKNKLGFVDGTLPQPNIDDPLRFAWERNNKVLLAWLVHVLHLERALDKTEAKILSKQPYWSC